MLLAAAAVVYLGFVRPGRPGWRVAGALGCVAVVAAFLALGEDEYTVPDVTGLTVGVARARLEEARLDVFLSTPARDGDERSLAGLRAGPGAGRPRGARHAARRGNLRSLARH